MDRDLQLLSGSLLSSGHSHGARHRRPRRTRPSRRPEAGTQIVDNDSPRHTSSADQQQTRRRSERSSQASMRSGRAKLDNTKSSRPPRSRPSRESPEPVKETIPDTPPAAGSKARLDPPKGKLATFLRQNDDYGRHTYGFFRASSAMIRSLELYDFKYKNTLCFMSLASSAWLVIDNVLRFAIIDIMKDKNKGSAVFLTMHGLAVMGLCSFRNFRNLQTEKRIGLR